jgi:GAF domain-containing protein
MPDTTFSVLVYASRTAAERHSSEIGIIRTSLAQKGFQAGSYSPNTGASLPITAASDYAVLVVVTDGDAEDVWQRAINSVKSANRFAELIAIDYSATGAGAELLRSGYYAYFRPDYEPEVVTTYVEAAQERIRRRRERYASSNALNAADELKDVVAQILALAKKLSGAEKAQLVLLSKRDGIALNNQIPDPGGFSKYVRTLVETDPPIPREDVTGLPQYPHWDLVRPLYHDRLMLKILNNEIQQRVFPDVSPEALKDSRHVLAGLWDSGLANDVFSWIVLPLIDNNKPIAILTLEHHVPGALNYSRVSENALRQFADQAALALRVAQQKNASDRLAEAQKALFRNRPTEDVLKEIATQAGKLADALFCYVMRPTSDGQFLDAGEAVWSRFDESHPGAFAQFLEEHHHNRINISKKEEKHEKHEKYSIVRRAFEGITKDGKASYPYILLDECTPSFNKRLFPDTFTYQRYLKDYRPVIFDPQGDGRPVKPCSDIALPIVDPANKERVLGVINIEHELPCGFPSEIVEKLRAFAELAAVAIRNSQETDEIKALFEAEKQPDDLDNIRGYFNQLAATMQKAVDATGGVKIFARWENYTFRVDAQPQQADETRGDGGHTRLVIEHRKRLFIPDVARHNREVSNYQGIPANTFESYKGIPVNHKTVERGDKAVLCLPMILGGEEEPEVIGAIWLHFKTVSPNLSDDQLERLQLFANRAAAIFHHYKERALLSISEAISEKLPQLHKARLNPNDFRNQRNTIAQAIVQRVQELFDVDALFYIANHDRKRLEVIATTQRNGVDFMPKDKTIPFDPRKQAAERGFAGNLFADKRKPTEYWENYNEHPYALEEDKASRRLQSVFGIRLESLFDDRGIGVLVVNGSIPAPDTSQGWAPRKFENRTQQDLKRFASLAADLLAFSEFDYQPLTRWQKAVNTLTALGIIFLVGIGAYIQIDSNAAPALRLLVGALLIVISLLQFSEIKQWLRESTYFGALWR